VLAAADDVAEFDMAIDTYGRTALRRFRVRRRNTKQGQERWSPFIARDEFLQQFARAFEARSLLRKIKLFSLNAGN
jgi:hypothetical protein